MEPKDYKNLFEKQVKEVIEEVFRINKDVRIMLITGHEGMKDALKAHCEIFGKPYTWRNMRKMYYFLINTGAVTVNRWYEEKEKGSGIYYRCKSYNFK